MACTTADMTMKSAKGFPFELRSSQWDIQEKPKGCCQDPFTLRASRLRRQIPRTLRHEWGNPGDAVPPKPEKSPKP